MPADVLLGLDQVCFWLEYHRNHTPGDVNPDHPVKLASSRFFYCKITNFFPCSLSVFCWGGGNILMSCQYPVSSSDFRWLMFMSSTCINYHDEVPKRDSPPPSFPAHLLAGILLKDKLFRLPQDLLYSYLFIPVQTRRFLLYLMGSNILFS